jgi:hypothetical protein
MPLGSALLESGDCESSDEPLLMNFAEKAMSYNLTDNQKDVARWLVYQISNGDLKEEFQIFWGFGGSSIPGFKGEVHPGMTQGSLDALASAGILICTPDFGNPMDGHKTEVGRRCILLGRAYEAVESDFVSRPDQSVPQVTIGAIIQTMSGGSVQAVGVAQNAEVSQVVSDPELLRSQVEALTENLLNEVKSTLKVGELAEYAQAIQDLREQLLAEEPDPPSIRRLARTVGLLGDIEGTIALVTRVWTFLHLLLLIAAAKLR